MNTRQEPNPSRDRQGAVGRNQTADARSKPNEICAGPPLPDGRGSVGLANGKEFRVGYLAFLIPLLLNAAPKTPVNIAGNGVAGFSEQQINNPYGLVVGPDGALYFCEIGNHIIRRLDLKTRKLSIAAGNPMRCRWGNARR